MFVLSCCCFCLKKTHHNKTKTNNVSLSLLRALPGEHICFLIHVHIISRIDASE